MVQLNLVLISNVVAQSQIVFRTIL